MEIDVFWSFRSPRSYLATKRIREMQEKYELDVNYRPVYPIAIRTEDFFNSVNPLWMGYLLTDVFRVAEYLELPFVWPSPDPVVQFMDEEGKFKTGEDQPYIYRLTKLGVVAANQGKGIEFADEVSKLIWGGTKDWDKGDALAKATLRSGLDLESMDQIVNLDGDNLESQIQGNQEDHQKAGHWGVPTCVYQDEPFFGQDRLDVLLWRLKQAGLKERAS
ncbi:MAG: DsbA family protein [Pseudomonadales bacterium]|nr:DsbA family protein [Pseudomonadales bacterium]